MPKKQVALVLSGGVSLGAYIAGALDELMHAFAASDQYEIDIITGASAGATNAALIGHGLLHRGGATSLYDIWVDQLDMIELLAPNLPSAKPVSLLDGRKLQEIANKVVAWPDPTKSSVRAPFCTEKLTIAMTLTNMTPLSYVSRVKQPAPGNPESYIEQRYAEQETFDLGPATQPTHPIWQRIADTARASAAFPLLFPMVRLTRRADNILHYLHRPEFEGEQDLWYYDGGTFNNVPVDLAWHYIRARGGNIEPGGVKDRVIVIVDPSRNDVRPPLDAPAYPGVVAQALSLLGAIYTESRATQLEDDAVVHLPPARRPGGLESMPGANRAPVELLSNVALVIPQPGAKPLRGVYLNALSAFLDRQFREYDFRRGAADGRRVATQLLGLTYEAARPAGFYEPDADKQFDQDISRYEYLANYPSSHDRQRSIQKVFEDALNTRIDAIIKAWDAPGPDILTDPVVAALLKRFVHQHLPTAWTGKQEQEGAQ